MPNSLTSQGLTLATQAELVANYTAALQSIYGSSINLSSNTPDGQWMNILIQATLDVQDLMMQVYNSFDPDNAIGVVLDQRVAINGIQRLGGTFTVTNVTIVNSQSINLYGLDQSTNPVYTVSDNAGNQWQLITTELGVTAGSHVYAFQASNPGAVISIPNTIIVPVTIVLGVTSINNPTTYTTLGINEETDAALKVRRQMSVALSSQGYLQGLLAALENIDGVSSSFVYENTTASTNIDGVPGHSIWVIIAGNPSPPIAPTWSASVSYPYNTLASLGGVNYISWINNNLNNNPTSGFPWAVYNPVAQAIYNKRNAGCGMFGSIGYTVTQIDGNAFPVFYDMVVEVPIFIKFTSSSLDGIHIPNIHGIIQNLPIIFVPGVFKEVNINELATFVQQIDPNTLVTVPGFSATSTGSYTNTFNPSSKKDQLQISSSNIIILPMILNAPNATPTFNGSNQVTQMNVSVVHGGNTIQFTGLGGHGTLTYAMVSGAGSINSSTGLYTSATAGTDTVRVTDSLSNTTISVITVT